MFKTLKCAWILRPLYRRLFLPNKRGVAEDAAAFGARESAAVVTEPSGRYVASRPFYQMADRLLSLATWQPGKRSHS